MSLLKPGMFLSALPLAALFCAALPSEAAARPNLVVEIQGGAATVQAGETVMVAAVVSNRGPGMAYGVGYNLLLPSGATYTIVHTPGNCSASRVNSQVLFICMDNLPPAGSSVLALGITFPVAGDYFFSSTVDPSNLIRETRENDNSATLTVPVQ